MSFVTQDDVIELGEAIVAALWRELAGYEIAPGSTSPGRRAGASSPSTWKLLDRDHRPAVRRRLRCRRHRTVRVHRLVLPLNGHPSWLRLFLHRRRAAKRHTMQRQVGSKPRLPHALLHIGWRDPPM